MLFGGKGDSENLTLRNFGRRLIRIDGYRMRDGIARHVFCTSDLAEATGVVTRLAQKLILLVIGILAENRYPIIGSPTEEKVLVGIDPRSIFGGLFEGCIIDYVILLRSLDVILLDGTGRHQSGSNPNE